ncbi:PKD domain-containing protein [Malonomonas rubra DSM 5091]|uniref:PKD domain-containing protein n=1 Tax=Malonomonas rubra DSM 5091 TaxID=1122189 RepID=A0A1M6DUL6_MALRU|nr:PKD domain-containing protein [Malonomonas rubra]SHI76865.1 PKD domain-containing protein [Malonomonas rubra DSM 5091]
MTAYNAAEGKYDVVNSLLDTVSGEQAVPFDYGTEAEFIKKVDLSVAGNIMDCGECHVGGGAMEYIPHPDMTKRTPLVDLATTGVVGFGGTAGVAAPITAANYTAFNYFIDNYDVDGDGNKTEAQYIDYAQAGVMEMDCLMCHLPGYDYVERRHQLRTGKLGSLAAIGAGFASDNGAAYGTANFGTTVVYDNVPDNGSNLQLSGTWMDENIAAVPDANNCAFCHMNEFSVDWKKRGDHWAPEGQYDFAYEVHYNLGCMGCHERDTDTPPSWVGSDPTSLAENYVAQGLGSLGHDPAKGMYAQYSGLYNKNDNVQFKDCVDCHVTGTEGGQAYGAPNPTAAHEAAGLNAVVAQGANTMDGNAKVSHIDMMHCSTCHSRKIDSYAWGNTGAPMIDATGADHDGRLTDHENTYVTKPDMTDQTSLQWFKGKLRAVQPSATMFYRDKNDTPALDANFDGRPHGMDALLMTDVLAVNAVNGWNAISYDTHGNVTQADFATRLGALATYIENKAGVAAGTAKIKFSIFHVNFANQHAVSPAQYAWGSGAGNNPLDPADDNVDTCTDCHSSASNFYNGFVDTTGPTVMNYGASTSQRVPFTKVNGFSQPTDWHPNQFDKFAKRSIAIQISNVDNGNGGLTTRSVQKSENAYEASFMTTADFAPSYTSSGAIDFTGFEKGWLLKVQAREIATGTVTTRSKAVGVGGGAADVANVTELLASLGTFTSDFEFTVTADGAGTGITITADPGYEIKLAGGVDNSASFKLSHAAYQPATWTAVDGSTHTGRASWVAYLDSIDSSDLPAAGEAIIVGLPATVEVGSTVTLTADETANDDAGSVSYSWICNDTTDDPETPDVNEGILDGPVVDKTFSKIGTWTVTLRVVDTYGDLITVSQDVQVTAPAPAADIAVDSPSGLDNSVTFSNLPAHDMLYIIWGDGARQRVYDTAASVSVPHNFSASSRYFDGSNYNYRTTVYVYNGSTRVDIKREILTIAP